MTQEEIEKLKALALAASKGRWELAPVMNGGINHLCPVAEGMSLLTVVHDDGTPFGAVYMDSDAKFIEAAQPVTILSLIAQLEARPAVAEPAKCECCDGKGGWKIAEWVDPESGPECEGEICTDCNGTGHAPAPAVEAERLYMDHGLLHDRVTGEHLYTQDQYDEQRRDSYAAGVEDQMSGIAEAWAVKRAKVQAAAVEALIEPDDKHPHADLINELRQRAEAYPVEIFPDLTPEQRTHAGESIITRCSAGMGRHFSDALNRAADALCRSAPPPAIQAVSEQDEILALMEEMSKHPQLKSVIGREALILRCVRAALAKKGIAQ